jgi:hypothetical protein
VPNPEAHSLKPAVELAKTSRSLAPEARCPQPRRRAIFRLKAEATSADLKAREPRSLKPVAIFRVNAGSRQYLRQR